MFVSNILIEVRCYDNRGEFKRAVKALYKRVKIQIVWSCPYYPQTQGSIEIANQTFKNRLYAA